MNCPVCRSDKVIELDRRASVPVAQNLIFRSRESAQDCARGSLLICRCMACGFVWNAAFDEGLVVYDTSYENNQSLSPAFKRHLQNVAGAIHARLADRVALVAIEIGCGQGYFLRHLSEAFAGQLKQLVGFDPAYRGEERIPSDARVDATHFTAEASSRLDLAADLLVSRHVIEHIADPLQFLRISGAHAETAQWWRSRRPPFSGY